MRLTSEDGTRLDVGLESVNGVTPSAVSGQVSGNQIGFPSVVSTTVSGASIAGAPVDFTLRQTHAGVDAHLTLRGAAQGGSVVFTLSPGAGSFLEQETNGQVLVRTPQQFCGNAAPRDCLTIDAANYEIGVPVVRDSSSDPAQLSLSIDPAGSTMPRGSSPSRSTCPSLPPAAAARMGCSAPSPDARPPRPWRSRRCWWAGRAAAPTMGWSASTTPTNRALLAA